MGRVARGSAGGSAAVAGGVGLTDGDGTRALTGAVLRGE